MIILCYSVIDRQSFDRIKTFWIPELRKNLGKRVPIVLTATHTDLRNDKYIKRCIEVVSSSEGKQLADSFGAKGFYEISRSNISQTNDIFECAVKAVVGEKRTLFTIFKKVFCNTRRNKNWQKYLCFASVWYSMDLGKGGHTSMINWSACVHVGFFLG